MKMNCNFEIIFVKSLLCYLKVVEIEIQGDQDKNFGKFSNWSPCSSSFWDFSSLGIDKKSYWQHVFRPNALFLFLEEKRGKNPLRSSHVALLGFCGYIPLKMMPYGKIFVQQNVALEKTKIKIRRYKWEKVL